MNTKKYNKGFTLVELLATIVIIGIITGIVIVIFNVNLQSTKDDAEEVFVDTIRTTLDVYLASGAKQLVFEPEEDDSGNRCFLQKKHGTTQSRHKTALQIAGERNFKDFREDKVLDIRQFQMAFRKLRQFSARMDVEKTELDIDQTIDKTCEHAGMLNLVYEKPRKNTVKILLLIDSDGSMLMYSRLVNKLFQAISKANHFKDLKVYYFHNCVYDHLYTNPYCRYGEWVDTQWVLNNLDSEYKVIFVGDGTMAPSELHSKYGNSYYSLRNEEPGINWLMRIKRKFKKQIWLNPIRESEWEWVYGHKTLQDIKKIFPMFELTLDGLDRAIKKLLTR